MQWLLHLAAALLAAAVAWAATAGALRLLHARQVMDLPNERSSHSLPTPRGGGIAVMAVIAAGWLAISLLTGAGGLLHLAVALALALSALSFYDDLRGLPVAARLAAQALAVAIALALLPAEQLLLQGMLPYWADRLVALLAWLWFINLYNFMDGIDGITAAETVSIAGGIAAIAIILGLGSDISLLATVIAGAVTGFALWNLPPARIFMGDVGSIGLGFLLGWLLFELAGRGQWAAAAVLPMYYLADASLTLGWRLLRGEAVWRAHRSHFYQRAALALGSHGAVSARILAANAALILIALSGIADGLPQTTMLFAAAGVTGGLLCYFQAISRRKPDAEPR